MKVNIRNDETGVFAIGGLDEIGKNTYEVQFQDEITIIDVGIKFPEGDLPGVDCVIPNYSYIIQNLHKVKALAITHGHKDHTGDVPYLLRQANTPIYAGSLALTLITSKLDEYDLLRGAEPHEINGDTVIHFRRTVISFFRMTHSIPDALGIVVKAPSGNIVTTGDFGFDFTPVGGPASLYRMAKLSGEDVLYLLSDSTNAEIPTFIGLEKTIGISILKIFEKIDGRIIFTSLASDIFRLQQAIGAAVRIGRKVAIFGHSMEDAIISGGRLGYIKVPKGTLVDTVGLNQLPVNETMILCTGSQGKPVAALSRIANGAHRQINVQPGDMIAFSNSPIPGSTTNVNRLINLLSRAGTETIHGKVSDIHTSGHGGQEKQKLMPRLIKPRYFMPVHNKFRILKIHVSLAQDTEVPEENCFIIGDGDVLALTADSARPAGHFNANDMYVGGSGIDDIGNVALWDRRILSEEGLVLTVVIVDIENKEIMAGPGILSRGSVYVHESGDMIHEGQRLLLSALREAVKDRNCTETKLGEAMTTTLQPFLFEQTERHPMILPVIVTATVNDQ